MIEFCNVKLGSGKLYFEERPQPQPTYTYGPAYTYGPGYPYRAPHQVREPPPPEARFVSPFRDPPERAQAQAEAQREDDRGPGHKAFFVCPRCGFTEARWHEGKFRCLRCGGAA